LLKALAVVPARGGSKGIFRKNLCGLAGKPLIVWTILAAREACRLERIVVSTDDSEIADVSRAAGAEVPFLRPEALAQDETPMREVLAHCVAELAKTEGYRPDIVVTLQPTSPLRTSAQIDEALEIFESHPDADSLVSCVRVPHHFHPSSVMKLDDSGYLQPYLESATVTRRQDKAPTFARNGPEICITRVEKLDEYVFGGRLIPYIVDEREIVDIDEISDLERAESILAQTENQTHHHDAGSRGKDRRRTPYGDLD
jgi:CMP-N,N'-diacetyllegionaminic acid synthase